MKFLLAFLSLLPATLAVDTCLENYGCAGCAQVANTEPFVQNGNEQVANAPGWATFTVSDSTIALENVSGNTLTLCVFNVVCYYISPKSECTIAEPDNFSTENGMQVWRHP